jgi:hypothetical protein
VGAVRIIRVPPAGGTAAPLSVPTYASATYGCALAHSPQTTLEVRASFYSRLSQPVTAIARPVSIGPHFWGSITCDRSIPHSGVRSAGDSIYDKSLTGEPILPSRTVNQYLNQFYRSEPRTNIWPDIGSRFATVKLVHRSEIYHFCPLWY